jgi:hypothetical protein
MLVAQPTPSSCNGHNDVATDVTAASSTFPPNVLSLPSVPWPNSAPPVSLHFGQSRPQNPITTKSDTTFPKQFAHRHLMTTMDAIALKLIPVLTLYSKSINIYFNFQCKIVMSISV